MVINKISDDVVEITKEVVDTYSKEHLLKMKKSLEEELNKVNSYLKALE